MLWETWKAWNLDAGSASKTELLMDADLVENWESLKGMHLERHLEMHWACLKEMNLACSKEMH